MVFHNLFPGVSFRVSPRTSIHDHYQHYYNNNNNNYNYNNNNNNNNNPEQFSPSPLIEPQLYQPRPGVFSPNAAPPPLQLQSTLSVEEEQVRGHQTITSPAFKCFFHQMTLCAHVLYM